MIHGRLPTPRAQSPLEVGTFSSRDRAITVRFLAGLCAIMGLCVLLFLGPALYFVEQNYETFKLLAYDVKPSLLAHLEREMIWLRLFFLLGSVTTIAACLIYGRRFLRSLLHPMQKMEDHLISLTRGDWWTQAPPMPGSDAHRPFFLTYTYFYRSLREKAEAELNTLQKISIDPEDRESYNAWSVLLDSYRARLGVTEETVSDSSATSAEAEPSRRAS